jgi:hypothetical protein
MTELGKYTKSFGLSFAITSILSALLVIIKESNEGLLNVMKAMTGHHWVTHGLINLIIFVAFGFFLKNVKMETNKIIICIVASVVISWLLIAGFYIVE